MHAFLVTFVLFTFFSSIMKMSTFEIPILIIIFLNIRATMTLQPDSFVKATRVSSQLVQVTEIAVIPCNSLIQCAFLCMNKLNCCYLSFSKSNSSCTLFTTGSTSLVMSDLYTILVKTSVRHTCHKKFLHPSYLIQ